MELKIPRRCAELLADGPIDPQWLQAILLVAPNEAVAVLATLIELGRDLFSFPETTRIDAADFSRTFRRHLSAVRSQPGRERQLLLQQVGGVHHYITYAIQAADELHFRFTENDTYWQTYGESQVGAQYNPRPLSILSDDDATDPGHSPMRGRSNRSSEPSLPKNRVQPTLEQEVVLQALSTSSHDDVVKAQAFAGTGKTSLCAFIGEELPYDGTLYLAFNKVMADQARFRLGNMMECRTTDSLAYKYLRPWEVWGDERTQWNQKMPWSDLADRIGLPQRFGHFSRSQLIRQVHFAVLKYCYSSSPELGPEHVPDLDWPDRGEGQVLAWATDLWTRMLIPGERIPVAPAQVMKVWDLKGGTINAEMVLFDEAQDANAAFMSVLRRSACRRVLIGDHHQQLYEWRGAVDAMHLLEGPTFPLTKSWRFGPEIAEFANRILESKTKAPIEKITGDAARSSKVHIYDDDKLPQWPLTVLARSNVTVFYTAVDVAESGHKLHVVGDIDDMRHLLLDALSLYRGEGNRVSHRQLVRFGDWDALVIEQEMTGDPELRRIVKIVEDRNERLEGQLETLSRFHIRDPRRADAILSTTHRVKGMEWERVMLANDFIDPSRLPEIDAFARDAELNILYVAATRAVRELYVPRRLASGFSFRR